MSSARTDASGESAESQRSRIEQRRRELESKKAAIAAHRDGREAATPPSAGPFEATGGSASAEALPDRLAVERVLRREDSACKSSASKEAPGARGRSGMSSARTDASGESAESQRSRIEQRRRELESKKAAIAAQKVAREKPASPEAIVPEVAQLPAPSERALARQDSACKSNASKDGPSSRAAVAGDRSDATSQESTASQRERLEARRQELAARKAAVKAERSNVTSPGMPPLSVPQLPALPTLAASAEWAERGDGALLSHRDHAASASKEGPSGRSTRRSEEASSDSIASQRDRLEARRRELAARKAALASKSPATPPVEPERVLQRQTSACKSDAVREAPTGGRSSHQAEGASSDSIASQRERVEEKRRELAARKAARAARQ